MNILGRQLAGGGHSPLEHIDPPVIESFDHLARRATTVSGALSRLVDAGSTNVYLKTFAFLLSEQTEAGYWEGAQPIWNPIITAQVIEALVRIGVPLDAEWETASGRDGNRRRCSIARSLDWLILSQRPDGSWGEDSWTVCEILRVLLLTGQSKDAPCVQRAVEHLIEIVNGRWKAEEKNPWFGAAFPAVVAALFRNLGHDAVAQQCLEEIWTGFDPDGKFHGPRPLGGMDDIPSEWHTAQVLIALNRIGFNPEDNRLRMSADWLRGQQRPDGSWGATVDWVRFIYTHDALTALVPVLGSNDDSIKLGCKWFLGRQEANGKIIDIGVSARAALLFQLLHPEHLAALVPFPLILDVVEVIARQREALSVTSEALVDTRGQLRDLKENYQALATQNSVMSGELRTAQVELSAGAERLGETRLRVEALEKLIQSYWVKLTDRHVAVISLGLGLLGLIAGLVLGTLGVLPSRTSSPSVTPAAKTFPGEVRDQVPPPTQPAANTTPGEKRPPVIPQRSKKPAEGP